MSTSHHLNVNVNVPLQLLTGSFPIWPFSMVGVDTLGPTLFPATVGGLFVNSRNIMEDSTPSLLVGDVRPPHHLHLPVAGSDSYLSPSSALIHANSESSHRSHIHWDSDECHDTEKPRPYRSSLIQVLRDRFPDGPPAVYDEFIRVSLNEIPPEASLHENDGYKRPSTTTRLTRMTSQLWSVLAGSIASRPCEFVHNVCIHPNIDAHSPSFACSTSCHFSS